MAKVFCLLLTGLVLASGVAHANVRDRVRERLGATPPVVSETPAYELEMGEQKRRYLLHVPPSEGALPLYLMLHPLGTTPAQQEEISGFSKLADERGFIVAYPEGLDKRWRVFGQDDTDVEFLKAVIADVSARNKVDAARVYVAGFSNGAQMAWRLVCRAPTLLAGAAFVSGNYPTYDDCTPSTLPLIAFHGTADRVLPYEGRAGQWGPLALLEKTAADRRCGPPFTIYSDSQNSGVIWGQCPQPVELYTLRDMGHSWPGSAMPAGITSQTIKASSLMLDFLKDKQR